jgi:hypothetical protein
MDEMCIYPTRALPGEGDVQDSSNPESPASDTELTRDIANADAPTIPSFLTVAEKFADEFWTSATTTETATVSPSTIPNPESPTDPFEFVPSPGCSDDDGSKSNGDLIHEETHTTHPNAEGEVGAGAPNVEQIPSEVDADKQIDDASPIVPSAIPLDPSGTSDSSPTPEPLALAARPTPAQEEVDAAWPTPSNDVINAADAWGIGTIATPGTNPGDSWGPNNDATAADTWGTEAKGDKANNGWSGGGGWKSNKGKSDDQSYGKGGFRRDRPLWQPPERDGGWEGFRKRGGYVGDSHVYPGSLPWFIMLMCTLQV